MHRVVGDIFSSFSSYIPTTRSTETHFLPIKLFILTANFLAPISPALVSATTPPHSTHNFNTDLVFAQEARLARWCGVSVFIVASP